MRELEMRELSEAETGAVSGAAPEQAGSVIVGLFGPGGRLVEFPVPSPLAQVLTNAPKVAGYFFGYAE
jgi:hypothetical protein